MEESRSNKGSAYFIPLAIIIAGVVVAGAVIYTSGTKAPGNSNEAAAVGVATQETPETPQQQPDIANVAPITATDHILGNPNAPVKIIEYSDIECPFCKVFHNTLHKVMETYGKEGKVAWVFRHFPIQSLHSQAPTEAVATECVAKLAGEDTFWQYLDNLFEITPSNNGLDLSLLPSTAEDMGVDSTAFENCITHADSYMEQLNASIQNAVASGAQGTPYSIIISSDGTPRDVINGAEPYESVVAKIDAVLGAE